MPVAAAAVGVWLVLRWRGGERRLALTGLGAIVGAVVTAELLKLTLASRPGVPHWFDHGYPSGHTTTTCTTAFVVLLLAPGRRWALVAAAAFTTLIAAGVVLDGWHLPSDVLGGLLLSGTWLFALVALLEVPRPPRPSPRDAALAVLAAAVVVAVLLVHAGIPTHAPVTHVQREAVAALGAAALASVLAAAALLGARR